MPVLPSAVPYQAAEPTCLALARPYAPGLPSNRLRHASHLRDARGDGEGAYAHTFHHRSSESEFP